MTAAELGIAVVVVFKPCVVVVLFGREGRNKYSIEKQNLEVELSRKAVVRRNVTPWFAAL